jgi:glycosyltransferase involved in cell wall biosynthesis
MKIHYLIKKIAWFGKYSGYECLPNYMPQTEQMKFFVGSTKLYDKVIGKLFQLYYGWKDRSPNQVLTDLKFLGQRSKSDISHILYLDYHFNLLAEAKPADNKLVGTIHIPIEFWKDKNLQLLPKLKNYIILYQEEVEQFQKYAPESTFHVIKHGVDINFFAPSKQLQVKRNKVLFIGHYLRNFEMFYKVYQAITETVQAHNVEIHFIIPKSYRNNEWLQKLSANNNIFFHEKLSDEELLAHYQDSYLMMMPMNNSGANTAIVQALSVGLPVLTTDVGGIRSYGGGSVYPVVANDDWQGMADLFIKYYNEPQYRDQIAHDVRRFSVEELDWHVVGKKHIQVYQKIIKS